MYNVLTVLWIQQSQRHWWVLSSFIERTVHLPDHYLGGLGAILTGVAVSPAVTDALGCLYLAGDHILRDDLIGDHCPCM